MSTESDHIAAQFDKRREAQRKMEEAKRKQDAYRQSDCAIAWLVIIWEGIKHVI